MPITMSARCRAWVLAACILGSWVRIPLKVWMFVLCRQGSCDRLTPVQEVLKYVEKLGFETSPTWGDSRSPRTVEPRGKESSSSRSSTKFLCLWSASIQNPTCPSSNGSLVIAMKPKVKYIYIWRRDHVVLHWTENYLTLGHLFSEDLLLYNSELYINWRYRPSHPTSSCVRHVITAECCKLRSTMLGQPPAA
jgi:hypothetical protein